MNAHSNFLHRWREGFTSWFLRLAASGLAPARWFQPPPPPPEQRAAKEGFLQLEIVSHCWKYSHLLAYQLSSVVLHPPSKLHVTMTVFSSPEDKDTGALLDFFSTQQAPGVSWNWCPLRREQMFRRAIGRNLAAKETQADWIWFTDCDVVFGDGCLDGLADVLQGRTDALVFPRQEHVTPLLRDTDPLLAAASVAPRLVEASGASFATRELKKASGPMQIVHGDVARARGYCEGLRHYQTPAATWQKCYEDVAFRWLLGTRGTPIDIPHPQRIRHMTKGRYTGSRWSTRLRSWVRRTKLRWQEG